MRANRRSYHLGLALVLLAQGCAQTTHPEQDRAARPRLRDVNVVLITIDTLRADYLSCYGKRGVSTPNIDALAARGVRFAQAIAQVPLTAPSHASILTGSYPQVHKVRDMGGFVLDKKIPTLATILGDAGYETAAFVGAAVLNHHYGMNRGFAEYSDSMKAEKGPEKLPGVVAEVRGEIVRRRALNWIDRYLSKTKNSGPASNFFLWTHFYDPHFPYDPPEPYRSQHPTDKYGGEVAYADAQIGALMEELKKRGILDKTLIVLMADHGESLGEHGEYTHGVFLYDSTVHIPLIVAGPGIPAGRVVNQQVRSIDVMPTIAGYLALSPGTQAQGVSLLPAIVEGKGVRSNYCYMETLYPKSTMGWSELRGMRTDDWKLVVAPKPELYRMAQDPAENNNLVSKRPAEADQLQKKVWEVAGPPQSLGELQPQPLDEERRRELQSLGYVGAGSRTLRIDMSGPDPKDRVDVLGVLEQAAEAINHDRFRAAVPMLQKLIPRDSGNPTIYKHLALCYQRLGQYDNAEKVYLEAIKNKAESDQTHADLGGIYVRRGDLQRAVESMERAARLNPSNLENMDNLATAYLQLGRAGEAQRVLRAVMAQNERHAPAHNLLGLLEIQGGRGPEARSHFEKAIECNPDLAEPYMNLGLLAQNAGEARVAIANYKQFLKRADPEKHREVIPKVKEALADLEAANGR